MTLEEVQETLSINRSLAYTLVRSGELRAIRVGGRGQWRIEQSELEAFISRAYEATATLVEENQCLAASVSEHHGRAPLSDLALDDEPSTRTFCPTIIDTTSTA